MMNVLKFVGPELTVGNNITYIIMLGNVYFPSLILVDPPPTFLFPAATSFGNNFEVV